MPQPRSVRRVGQGVALRSQSKCIIMNVLKSVSLENPTMSRPDIQNKVADMCGISFHTLRKLITESNKLKDNETFTTPGKKRNRINKKVNLDSFQRSALRNIVYNFHTTHKKLPCLRSLLRVLKTEHPELGLEFTHETLGKILRNLGFRWKKTSDNRKILLEKDEIRLKRINCLRKIHDFRREGRPIVFSDESYVHSTHVKSLAWGDDSPHGYKKKCLKEGDSY